jgi:hypothetical protein
MMITKKATSRSKVAHALKTEYAWVIVAALIVTLILGVSVAVPRVAALESTDQGGSEPSWFSSQAAAIDYYLAKLQREREGMEVASFSSQAAAIEYYLTRLQCERENVTGVSFSSQAAAIDYYLAMVQREREGTEVVSLSMACSLTN